MKKFISIILTLTILTCIAICGVSAVEVGYNGMYFEVDAKTKTATLVDYDGTDTSLAIPREVHGYEITEIADRAFAENSTLEYIYVPNTVIKVGSYAFSACSALDEVYLPSSVTSMGDAVFLNSTKLSKATINCNIAELPFNTFGSCSSLVDVNLGSFISKIGAGAFSNCTSLKNIPLNENIVAFSSNAFRGSGVEEVLIPSSVTELTWYSFANCSSLTKITIGKNVETIDSTAFKNCNNVIIYCYKNTVAHNFASNNNIPYVILDPYDLGDVDLSGGIDIKDATLIQKYLAEVEELNDTQLGTADYNQDGDVNIIDATEIQKYLVL